MEIVDTTKTVNLKLREEFLAPYRKQGDPFKSLLARSTYLTKYCRGNVETWTDTIRRVVEGNVNLAPGVTENEAQLLFHLFWTGQALPPGRGLWTGGVEGIPADASFNCWFVEVSSTDDWCWAANQLMLGGGVGVGLASIDSLPISSKAPARFAIWCKPDHADIGEVNPEGPKFLNGTTPVYHVADSREGWVTALGRVLDSAYEGKDLVIDVSDVRPRGALIKTFGGISCGPGPLVNLLRAVWLIVRGAAGRRLNSVECLDVTNHIGLCIKSGNIRRSALILLGKIEDQEFRNAKKDFSAVMSHRHTSNNSIMFDSWDQIEDFNWKGLVEDNAELGEPGLVNMALIRKTDPGAKGVNPCFSGDTLIAVADGREAVSIKQLSEEGQDVPVYSFDRATGEVEIRLGRNPRITGYQKKLLRVWISGDSYLDTTPEHKFILGDGSDIEAQNLVAGMSLPAFSERGLAKDWVVEVGLQGLPLGRTKEGKIKKICETCKTEFEVDYAQREVSFCTGLCSDVNAEHKTSLNHGGYKEITSVVKIEELLGDHTVYNITVDDFHTVAIITGGHGPVSYSGIFTAQCGEAVLHNREACNLAEVFPAKFEDSVDPAMVFRLVARYSLRQRMPELSDPLSDQVRKQNMRVGVGLGGICDFAWTTEDLANWFGQVRLEADRYADELGVNRPIAVTVTKPSGTISLLNGSSPGIHAPHAPYYIRRTRIAKNDPMAMAMMEAAVPFEEDVYDSTGNTWVFEFPTKAPHARLNSQTETIRDQIQRQATIQEWWADNAVSATLSFDAETEKEELAACLKEFIPKLKSTSCLPRANGYKQTPYEEIDEIKYHRMYSKINHNHPLVNGGDIEVEECSGGVCPIR